MTDDLAYVIQAEGQGGIVKVGRSGTPLKRLAGIAQSVPFQIRTICFLSHGAQTERELKAMLVEHRVRGEWFEPSPQLIEALQRYDAIGRMMRQITVDADFVKVHVIPRIQAYLDSKSTLRLNNNPGGDLVFRMLNGEPMTFIGRESELVTAVPNTFTRHDLSGWIPTKGFAEVSLPTRPAIVQIDEARA